MKNSIIYLGVVAAFFFQSANAETTLVSGIATDLNIATAVKADQYQKSLLEEIVSGNKKMAPVADSEIVNPEMVIANQVQKSAAEIIAEDQKITESKIVYDGTLYFAERSDEEIIAADNQITESNISKEVAPIFIERSIEDQIAADNSIIESNVPNEAQVLDFDQINKTSVLAKQVKSKQVIGMN